MTKLEQAARQALEALEELNYSSGTVVAARMYESATAALREALAEKEQIRINEREKYALFIETFKPDCQSFYPVEIQIANAIRNGDVK